MGARLREARDAINDGRYEDAVSAARLALETARKRDELATVNSYKDKNAKLLSVHERWSALHHALYQLTQVPHHDDPVTAGATWSRADAVTVLAVTVLAATRCAHRPTRLTTPARLRSISWALTPSAIRFGML